jgi:hypothetical protein
MDPIADFHHLSPGAKSLLDQTWFCPTQSLSFEFASVAVQHYETVVNGGECPFLCEKRPFK